MAFCEHTVEGSEAGDIPDGNCWAKIFATGDTALLVRSLRFEERVYGVTLETWVGRNEPFAIQPQVVSSFVSNQPCGSWER